MDKLPDIRQLKSFISQLRVLAKRLGQAENERKLWSGSAIYYQDLLLIILNNEGKSNDNSKFKRMSKLFGSLVSKIRGLEEDNKVELLKLFS